jgi:hypothetical protein
MSELGFALWNAVLVAGLLIVFRRQRSLQTRMDRLVLDHTLLLDRVMLLTLNRAPAQAIEPSSRAPTDRPIEAEPSRNEVHRLSGLKPIGAAGLPIPARK